MRRLSFPYVFLSLGVTLALAGLFYLPYLSVRNKTINAFHEQQLLLLDQAVVDIQGYFATYQRALEYLARQESIKTMNSGGQLLLEDFFAIHQSQLNGVFRTDPQGRLSLSIPAQVPEGKGWMVEEGALEGFLPSQQLQVSERLLAADGSAAVVLTQPIFADSLFLGNISFLIPCEEIARRYLESLKLERSGIVLLFSRQGQTLYAPDPDLLGRSVQSYQNEKLIQLYAGMYTHKQGAFALSEAFPGEEPPLPGERYGVHLPVDLPGGNFWSLLIVSPENQVLGTMAGFRKQWLMVTLITVSAVGLLGMGLSMLLTGRREEQERRQVEEQLVKLLDHAPMGVLLVDTEGRIAYANHAAVGLVDGGSQEELGGCSIYTFIPRDEGFDFGAAGVSGGPLGQAVPLSRQIETEHSSRDVVINLTPLPLGKELHHIVIVQDVTKERKVEEVQRRLATAVDQVKELVHISDTHGRIEYVNAAFCEITGYSREEVIGQSVRSLWSLENGRQLWRELRERVRKGEVWQGRITNQRKNGSVFISASSVSPVRNVDGTITHYVTVQRDITSEVAIESRLRQAEKMEAIGTLAGGIAHDFNNILGAIIGFTDMALLQSDKDSELHENLVHIRQGGRRAADLVQQILTFSRQSTLEKHPVTVAPLIKESLHLIRASLPSTIEIDQRILDPESKVVAAPVQLQQIIMNLCANAFYSMRDSGGLLTIVLEQLPSEKCGALHPGMGDACLCLTVQDTGSGMEDATVERIFTPFFTTKDPGEGTGMGLSVVLGIVQDLGGDIQVKSVLGKGTTFYIYLPLADGAAEGELLIGEVPLPTGNEHILVIDDEKEIRETCRMMLEHFGYSVVTSSNPLEVLSMIKEQDHPIDLVITDHTMPRMTGLELTREILKLRPELPVILCTGYSDKLNQEVAVQAGACELMMKPVDLQELATTVRKAIRGDGSPLETAENGG